MSKIDASASLYSGYALRLYDFVVCVVSNPLAWRCSTGGVLLPQRAAALVTAALGVVGPRRLKDARICMVTASIMASACSMTTGEPEVKIVTRCLSAPTLTSGTEDRTASQAAASEAAVMSLAGI